MSAEETEIASGDFDAISDLAGNRFEPVLNKFLVVVFELGGVADPLVQ